MPKQNNLSDKIILAHAGFFNKASMSKYRENSVEICKLSTKKTYISIIELDIRKSSDGILYCYHGTPFEYLFTLKIPRTFDKIRNKFHADKLSDVLDVITKDKTVFLDFKDTSITRADILKHIKHRKFKEVILANKSVKFLDRFHHMPKNCSKIMNGNIFCNFYDLEKLRKKNYKYFEVVFPFQVTLKNKERAEQHGLEFRCSGRDFANKEKYFKLINKLGIKQISSDYV